jgi:hypothetical protein
MIDIASGEVEDRDGKPPHKTKSSYFPAQNWERRVCDLNRSICGKLQGRTDLN